LAIINLLLEYTVSETITLTFKTNTPAEELRSQSMRIELKPDLRPGLLGLEPGRDILVLFYLHLIQPNEIELQLHPCHNPDNPLQGVFATRSQFRPNSIGASVARLESIEQNVFTVTGLDALDGTPVLDIKPYTPWFDADTHSQQLEVREVQSLADARAAIDAIDTEVIRLLGNRAGYVRQVVNFKQTAEDVRAPTRYAEVMRRRREMAQAAGLNPDVVEGMYKLLVDSFIQEEMDLLRQRK
jgi:tRNA-Thr(GGU) m(6)t(6)A37 methyltransferase TsaA